jgi:hypothetical protein
MVAVQTAWVLSQAIRRSDVHLPRAGAGDERKPGPDCLQSTTTL